MQMGLNKMLIFCKKTVKLGSELAPVLSPNFLDSELERFPNTKLIALWTMTNTFTAGFFSELCSLQFIVTFSTCAFEGCVGCWRRRRRTRRRSRSLYRGTCLGDKAPFKQ